MTLDKLKPHESAKITAVGGSGALRHHLLDMGLTPQTGDHSENAGHAAEGRSDG